MNSKTPIRFKIKKIPISKEIAFIVRRGIKTIVAQGVYRNHVITISNLYQYFHEYKFAYFLNPSKVIPNLYESAWSKL